MFTNVISTKWKIKKLYDVNFMLIVEIRNKEESERTPHRVSKKLHCVFV